MRIISGKLGGRRIKPPLNMPNTRPTTDVAKEGLFNILQNKISFVGIKTLDLFGGTGSISYELFSRGAGDITIVEKDPLMHSFIKNTIQILEIQNCMVIRLDAFSFLSTCTEKYNLIFAGPPYSLGTIDELPKIVISRKLLATDGYFVLEHTPRNNYERFAGFDFQRNYGTTCFSFFRQNK